MKLTPDKSDLAALERDLNRLPQAFERIHGLYTLGLTGGWKRAIFGVGAVDTARYFFSVSAREISGSAGNIVHMIDTSKDPKVFYSDIVERGRKDMPNYSDIKTRKTKGYPVRFPAGKSLEEQDSVDLLDQITTRELDRLLHG